MASNTLRPSRGIAAASLLVALSIASPAQTSLGGQPEGLVRPLGTPAPVIQVPTPDVAACLAEDEARMHQPLRYGAVVDVGVDVEDGAWTTLRDGARAWRIQLVSPGAKSLALEFARFELPEGARLYVYDEAQGKVLGAYTAANRHVDGEFVFEPFPGDRLTLEIDLPAGAPDPVLRTKSVIHDYRDVFGLMNGTVTVGGGGQESPGACLIDVHCPQGASWDDQKRATIRTLADGALCSGALINNTAGDGTAYFLTANHCGQPGNTVCSFLYQTSGCGTGAASADNTVTGVTLLATNPAFDCRLMRIDAPIPAAYQPYFAGWTRSAANATFALAMGHPAGGPKKISIDANGTGSQPDRWVAAWNEGLLLGGSSGGPLFDQDGRVKGPACCVSNLNCGGQTAWFGRFDKFYVHSALAQWLDPAGTNPVEINGMDPQLCTLPFSACPTSPNSVGPGARIGYFGTRSVGANDFHLTTSGLPPNSFGIYFYGQNQILQPFGNGLRCVGNPLVRLPIVSANPFGDADFALDVPATQIHASETWIFQYWYRNPAGGGAGFNLSDGIGVPFCP